MEIFEKPIIHGGNYLDAVKQAQNKLDGLDANTTTPTNRREPDLISLRRMVSAREIEDYLQCFARMECDDEMRKFAKKQLANMVIGSMKNEIIDALLAGGYINFELNEYGEMAWRIDMTIAALKPKIVLSDNLGLTTTS